MNTQGSTKTVQNLRGGLNPPSTSFTADVLLEAKTPIFGARSNKGVSTRNTPFKTIKPKITSDNIPRCYVIRCTYGRKKIDHDLFSTKGLKAYEPTITTAKINEGKDRMIEESRLPNILFASVSFEQLKVFVFDNQDGETKYLRFFSVIITMD